jgi:hypothetical protein
MEDAWWLVTGMPQKGLTVVSAAIFNVPGYPSLETQVLLYELLRDDRVKRYGTENPMQCFSVGVAKDIYCGVKLAVDYCNSKGLRLLETTITHVDPNPVLSAKVAA